MAIRGPRGWILGDVRRAGESAAAVAQAIAIIADSDPSGHVVRPMASDLSSQTVPATAIERPPATPFLIVGVTPAGRPFRPSDWADRLAGVMSSFQPPGAGPRSPLQYSPYAVPGVHGAHKCVRVDPAIAAVEPMALAFLLNFARDNDLMVALLG
jgi:hypothetical protein